MQLFLLTLCLVGLAQAGPTPPSYITDPVIRALYDNKNIYRFEELSSTFSDNVITICGPKERFPKLKPNELIIILQFGTSPQEIYTGEISASEKGDQKCYKISEAEEKPGNGKSFMVFIRPKNQDLVTTEAINANLDNFALGTVAEVLEVESAQDSLKGCSNLDTSFTFVTPPAPTGDLGKNCFFKSGPGNGKECLFRNEGGIVTLKNGKACIKVDLDMEYCQMVGGKIHHSSNKVPTSLKISSLKYGAADQSATLTLLADGQKMDIIKALLLNNKGKTGTLNKNEIKLNNFDGSTNEYTVCAIMEGASATLLQSAPIQDLNVHSTSVQVDEGQVLFSFDFDPTNAECKGNIFTVTAKPQPTSRSSLLGVNQFDDTDVKCDTAAKCYGFLLPKDQANKCLHFECKKTDANNVDPSKIIYCMK